MEYTSAYLIKWNDCIVFRKDKEGWTLEIKPVFPLSNDTWVKGVYIYNFIYCRKHLATYFLCL